MVWTQILFILTSIMPVFAQGDITQNIEDHFQLFIINEARQNPGDRTVVRKTKTGYKAIFYYWRNLDKRNPADVICDGYTWMLKGRTRYGKGARSAFQKFTPIESFELHFFDLEFGTKRAKAKGAFERTYKPNEYFQARITRQDLKKGNFKDTWIDQQIKEGQCQNLKTLFSRVWFDKEYIRKHS